MYACIAGRIYQRIIAFLVRRHCSFSEYYLQINQKRTDAFSRRGEKGVRSRAIELDGYLVATDLAVAVLRVDVDVTCFNLNATQPDGSRVVSAYLLTVHSHATVEIVDGEKRGSSTGDQTDHVYESGCHLDIEFKGRNCAKTQ